jgi:hypothetical protein
MFFQLTHTYIYVYMFQGYISLLIDKLIDFQREKKFVSLIIYL